MTNKLIIFCLGIFISAFAILVYPFKQKSDFELVQERLEEFNRIEEICGRGNVKDRCKYGYCSSDIGLTCYSWRKAAYEAEKMSKD